MRTQYDVGDQVAITTGQLGILFGLISGPPIDLLGQPRWPVELVNTTGQSAYMAAADQLELVPSDKLFPVDRLVDNHHDGLDEDALDTAMLKMLLAAFEEPCEGCRRIARIELQRRINAALNDDPAHWYGHLIGRDPARTRQALAGELGGRR